MAAQPVYAPAGQHWSEWSLDPDHQQYYYRARYVSYNEFISMGENERNKVRPDGQGHYVHYQFMSFQETEAAHAAQRYAPVYAAQDRLQVPYHNDDDGESGYSGTSGDANNGQPRVVMTVEETPEFVRINLPSKHTVILDKKVQKKLHSEKKKKVSPKAKVDRWLEEW